MNAPLLEVEDLQVRFALGGGGAVHAVDGVSFAQAAGETLGIVGESGCGKSTLARAILGLVPAAHGAVRFRGTDLRRLTRRRLRAERRHLQMVFQDPFASLDPRFTVARTLEEPLIVHGYGDRARRRRRVGQLLELVGLDADAAARFPHQFSGGQRQRVAVARAIAVEPELVIADEPVSALDLSIQAQILNLFLDLRRRLGLSYLFISHDLSVVRLVSDRVAVMYLGQFVELGAADDVLSAPLHPYTRALVSAVPRPQPRRRRDRIVLKGDLPSPETPPGGCRFHTRCPLAEPRCRQEPPQLRDLGAPAAPHYASCHLATRKP